MSMVCPKCNASFEQRIQCPACDVRLLYLPNSRPIPAGMPGETGQWQHTPYGRIFVGLLLAQGVYHGLQQLCTAGLIAITAESSREVWATLFGLVLQQGLQGFGILVGGVLAGAGQRRGIVIGTVLGILSCFVVLVVDYFGAPHVTLFGTQGDGQPLTIVAQYGQPLLMVVVGAVGGLISSLIWKPLPTLTAPAPANAGKSSIKLARRHKAGLFSGPIAWPRVVLGIAATVAGSFWANSILKLVLDSSDGKLSISSRLQAQLVTMEICALAVLIGSSLAGATTVNGLKQGLCVGIGATLILFAIDLRNPSVAGHKMVYTAISTLGLSLLGGWFGAHLFPPILGGRRRKVHAPSFQ